MPEITARETENIWGYAKRLRFVREWIGSYFDQGKTVKVLDIGCGNGSQLGIPLATDLRLKITGIDPDEASIEHARRLSGSRANLTFMSTAVDELSTDERFDVIILSEVLEHLRDPLTMLQAARRLLSPQGVMIITVPNGYGEFEIGSWIFRNLRVQKLIDRIAKQNEAVAATDNSESGHVQFFTRARLRRMFEKEGFVIVAERAASFLASPFAGHTVARSQRFVDWNARITDRLPLVLASGWYFALRRSDAEMTGAIK